MSTGLPLPLHIADLPVGATFTHKGVEYRKVWYASKIVAVEIMAARHPDHPGVFTTGGALASGKGLSVCTECPANAGACVTTYGDFPLPCAIGRTDNGTLIVTVDTAYELAVAGVASW